MYPKAGRVATGDEMREYKRVAVSDIVRDEQQPRGDFDPAGLWALGGSLKCPGQLVPVILLVLGAIYKLIDGERRWRAAQLVGLTHLDAIVFQEPPSAVELMVVQASLDVHRADLSLMERSDFLARIKSETSWSVTELAKQISQPQATVSKLLALQKLPEDVRQQVRAGELDGEKAYIISQEPDPAKQLELLNGAATMTRDQLRQKAKPKTATQEKTALARFPISAGLTVTVQGKEVTLEGAISALTETLKELKRGQAQKIGIDAMQRVLRDKAKAK
jgi:ParB family chromosome partitioning protein